MKKTLITLSLVALLGIGMTSCKNEPSNTTSDDSSITIDSSSLPSSAVDNSSTSSLSQILSDDTSSSTSSSSSSEEVTDPDQITLGEVETILEKALSFTNYNKIHFFRDDNERHDDINYTRYDYFYTLDGTADSFRDAWDEEKVIGYVGYPLDGSINVFYDIRKADIGTQHARAYTIVDVEEANNQLSEDNANKILNDYENNLKHFLDETYYYLLKNPDSYDIGSLKAFNRYENSKHFLEITASKTYETLFETYVAEFVITLDLNNDGSISKAHLGIDDGGIISENYIEIEYGSYYDSSTVNKILYSPKQYFVQDIECDFHDVYTLGEAKNTLSIQSAAYLMPHYDYIRYSPDFTYLPLTGLDYWDINVIDSSDRNVIDYNEEDGCFEAVGVGKTTLTVGAEYNPFLNCQVEVTVTYAKASSIVPSKPFNNDSYVGEAFTNTDITIPVSVGPYCAKQEMIVSSSNEDIATAYIDEDNNVKVHGISEGSVKITVAAKDNPSISKQFNINVVGELNKNCFVGDWEDTSYYEIYKMKFKYTFNDDGTGLLELTAQDFVGTEVIQKIAFEYTLDLENQNAIITPIDYEVQEDLLVVHYYTSNYLESGFTSGEYYFSVKLSRIL